MPELPEVEAAGRLLSETLTGRRLARVQATRTRVFRESSPARFSRRLRGQAFEGLTRRGKILLLRFTGDVGVLSHLGMSGKWIVRSPGDKVGHSRARLWLDDGRVVHYSDTRMFGQLAVYRASELLDLPEVTALGPDPIVHGIDVDGLHAKLKATERVLKVALLDQTLIAGLGNIYVTEALFRARLHPERVSSTVTRRHTSALATAILDSLQAGIDSLDVRNIEYLSEGRRVENPFLIYGRENEPCPSCGRPLSKITLGGRGTVFCRRCQKKPKSSEPRSPR